MRESSERFFDYSANGFCGVLIREPLMKKLSKIKHEYNQKIKHLLTNNLEMIEVSEWTLANHIGDDGIIKKQSTVKYYTPSTKEQKLHRINLSSLSAPVYVETVLEVQNREEAKEWCKSKIKEWLEHQHRIKARGLIHDPTNTHKTKTD